jgi:hypothetical protein
MAAVDTYQLSIFRYNRTAIKGNLVVLNTPNHSLLESLRVMIVIIGYDAGSNLKTSLYL